MPCARGSKLKLRMLVYHFDGKSYSESKEPRFRLLEIEANAVVYIHSKFFKQTCVGHPGWSRTRPKLVCCEAWWLRSNNGNHKTAKGIRKNVIKQDLEHDDYKNTLFNSEQMYHKKRTIRPDCHHLGSHEIKGSLSCFDDKRFLRKDGI